MDDLRWILLVIGVALVAGIYLFGRHRSVRDQSLLDAAHDIQVSDAAKRDRRTVEDPEEFDGIADQLEELNELLVDSSASRGHTDKNRAQAGQPSTMQRPFEKIIAIHVVAPRGSRFEGADLRRVFEERGYRFGEHNIYHSIHEDRTVFSVVNMVKPGWFDPQVMHEFETPGISLFLQLPGPLAAIVAFDILLAEANALADALGGSLQDASHSTLTQQTVQHLREEVQVFVRQSTSKSRHDH
jgi:cell division protein ZipA